GLVARNHRLDGASLLPHWDVNEYGMLREAVVPRTRASKPAPLPGTAMISTRYQEPGMSPSMVRVAMIGCPVLGALRRSPASYGAGHPSHCWAQVTLSDPGWRGGGLTLQRDASSGAAYCTDGLDSWSPYQT